VAPAAAVDKFLSDKASEQTRAGAAFGSRGMSADNAEIRNMLRAASIEKAKPFDVDAGRSEALTQSLAIDAADYLTVSATNRSISGRLPKPASTLWAPPPS
jgi:hypothetical protein